MIIIRQRGSLKKTRNFLSKIQHTDRLVRKRLEQYAQEGVDALAANTPVDTGATAASWKYEITTNDQGITISWSNGNKTKNSIPIVILLYYGHSNGRGGYVYGRDFITPAIRPIFEKIADEVWAEVKAL